MHDPGTCSTFMRVLRSTFSAQLVLQAIFSSAERQHMLSVVDISIRNRQLTWFPATKAFMAKEYRGNVVVSSLPLCGNSLPIEHWIIRASPSGPLMSLKINDGSSSHLHLHRKCAFIFRSWVPNPLTSYPTCMDSGINCESAVDQPTPKLRSWSALLRIWMSSSTSIHITATPVSHIRWPSVALRCYNQQHSLTLPKAHGSPLPLPLNNRRTDSLKIWYKQIELLDTLILSYSKWVEKHKQLRGSRSRGGRTWRTLSSACQVRNSCRKKGTFCLSQCT